VSGNVLVEVFWAMHWRRHEKSPVAVMNDSASDLAMIFATRPQCSQTAMSKTRLKALRPAHGGVTLGANTP